MKTVHAMMERVRAEFMEMPGLRLTVAQTQRLCGLERTRVHRTIQRHLEPPMSFRGCFDLPKPITALAPQPT